MDNQNSIKQKNPKTNKTKQNKIKKIRTTIKMKNTFGFSIINLLVHKFIKTSTLSVFVLNFIIYLLF